MEFNEAAEPETERSEPAEPSPESEIAAWMADDEAAQRAFVKSDALAFMARYPNFSAEDMEALESNPQFLRFCGTRYRREPLAQLYEDFQSVVKGAGEAAVRRAASRSARSTGGGTAGGETLSPEQRKALERWNEANPEMTMTAKEYLSM